MNSESLDVKTVRSIVNDKTLINNLIKKIATKCALDKEKVAAFIGSDIALEIAADLLKEKYKDNMDEAIKIGKKLIYNAAKLNNVDDLIYSFAFIKARIIGINDKNKLKSFPLLKATKKEYPTIVKILLTHPDIEVNKDYEGRTALITAANKGNTQIVELLLNHPKIKINQKSTDRFEWNALMEAAFNDKYETVKLLIKHGALVTSTYPANNLAIKELLETAIKNKKKRRSKNTHCVCF